MNAEPNLKDQPTESYSRRLARLRRRIASGTTAESDLLELDALSRSRILFERAVWWFIGFALGAISVLPGGGA